MEYLEYQIKNRIIKPNKFKNILFGLQEEESFAVHYSAVINTIKYNNKKYIVKLRPFFFNKLHCLLDNIEHLLFSEKVKKITNNKEWIKYEKKQLMALYKDLEIIPSFNNNIFILQFIEGIVAYNYLSDNGIDIKDKLKIITKLAISLKEMHNKNITHASPSVKNSIISDNGNIYWIDFETKYYNYLSEIEKKARDLKHFIYSAVIAVNNPLYISKIVKTILSAYCDKEVESKLSEIHKPSIFFDLYKTVRTRDISIKRFKQLMEITKTLKNFIFSLLIKVLFNFLCIFDNITESMYIAILINYLI